MANFATFDFLNGQASAGAAPLTTVQSSTNIDGYYASRTTAANLDKTDWTLYLDSGFYKLEIWGRKDSDCGLVDYLLDSVVVVSGQDWYNAAPVNGFSVVTGLFQVVTAGLHTISLKMNGKNGSSSGYKMYLSRIALRKN